MADRALGLQVGSPHALDYAAALARDSPTALSALATSSSQAQGSAAGRAVPTKTSGAPEDANDQNSGAAAAGGARPQSDAVAAPVSSDWPADGAAPPPVAADQQLGQQPAAAQQAPQQQQQQPAVPPPFGELRSLSGRRAEVWGGLRPVPGCSRLPYVLLQGRGVAIGRGQDVYHERLPQLMLSRAASLATAGSASLGVGGAPDTAAPPPASPTALGSGGIASPRDCQFVEVADGRISRLHVWVRWDSAVQRAVLEVRAGLLLPVPPFALLPVPPSALLPVPPSAPFLPSALAVSLGVGAARTLGSQLPSPPLVTLQDFSSNGTFINGLKVGCGRTAMLADGDRLSLVLSVAPLAELAFTFHQGVPGRCACTAGGQQGREGADRCQPAAGCITPVSCNPPLQATRAARRARWRQTGRAMLRGCGSRNRRSAHPPLRSLAAARLGGLAAAVPPAPRRRRRRRRPAWPAATPPPTPPCRQPAWTTCRQADRGDAGRRGGHWVPGRVPACLPPWATCGQPSAHVLAPLPAVPNMPRHAARLRQPAAMRAQRLCRLPVQLLCIAAQLGPAPHVPAQVHGGRCAAARSEL